MSQSRASTTLICPWILASSPHLKWKQECRKMVLLEKLWDDLVDRSESSCRLAGLRRITTPPLVMADARGGKFKRPGCSATVVTPTAPVCKDCVWDSVFYPGVENHHRHHQAAKPAGADHGAFLHKAQPTAYNGVYREGANSSKSRLLT